MPDREKVLHELEHQVADVDWCDNDWKDNVPIWMLRDTLALLKEQEPVKPEFDPLDGNVGRWRCGNCHISLGAVRPPFCWHCGRAVKWG